MVTCMPCMHWMDGWMDDAYMHGEDGWMDGWMAITYMDGVWIGMMYIYIYMVIVAMAHQFL